MFWRNPSSVGGIDGSSRSRQHFLSSALHFLAIFLFFYFIDFHPKAADIPHARPLQDSSASLPLSAPPRPSAPLRSPLPPSMKASAPLWECEKNHWRRRERLRCFKAWIDQMGSQSTSGLHWPHRLSCCSHSAASVALFISRKDHFAVAGTGALVPPTPRGGTTFRK